MRFVVTALARTVRLQVHIFQDRVEIINPGGLVAGLKREDLGKRSMPRNPLLFGLLHRIDLVENIGSGMKRIADSMAAYEMSAPDYEIDQNWFAVCFRRPGAPTSEAPSTESDSGEESLGSSPKTSGKIVERMTSNPRITIPELAQELGLTVRAVEMQVRSLREAGRIRRAGPAKGGHWDVLE